MTKIIDLDLPENYFEKDRYVRFAARIAKFDLQKGDVVRFHEVDEQGKRTKNFYDREVKDFHKIHKATRFWSKKDLTKFGFYILDFGKVK